MKILKIVFTICLMSIILMACEGPAGPMGPAGRDGRNGIDGDIEKEIVTIRSSEWLYDRTNGWFYATFKKPDIDQFILERGVMMIYQTAGTNTSNASKWPLPYIKRIESGIQEFYQFEYGLGWFTIYVEPSDFYTGYLPPTASFEIMLMWLD